MMKKFFLALPFISLALFYLLTIDAWQNLSLQSRVQLTTFKINESNKAKYFKWVSLDKISKYTLQAIISAEDSRFYNHYGIDFREIWFSFKLNLKKMMAKKIYNLLRIEQNWMDFTSV